MTIKAGERHSEKKRHPKPSKSSKTVGRKASERTAQNYDARNAYKLSVKLGIPNTLAVLLSNEYYLLHSLRFARKHVELTLPRSQRCNQPERQIVEGYSRINTERGC